MRIALFGPSLFRLAVGLRSNPANSVAWYVDQNSFILQRELRDEPLLNDTNFCRIDNWYSKSSFLYPSTSKIVQELKNFDIVLTADLGPIFGPYTGKPYVFLPAGGDLTSAPFPIRSRKIRKSGIVGRPWLKDTILSTIVGPQMRTGIKSAAAIWLWSGPFQPYLLALERLGIPQPLASACLPAAIDTDIFKPKPHFEEKYDKTEKTTTIFHPSRIMSSGSDFLKETGQWKQNEIFLEGVAKAYEAGIKIKLVLVEHPISPDEINTHRLLKELNIDKITKWIKAEPEIGFSWRELANLYQKADLVADDFGAGWFGTVALEAAACGKPVFNPVDEIAMKVLYKNGHPFLTDKEPSTIAKSIIEMQDPELKKEKEIASLNWAIKYHNSNEVANRCEKMIHTLLK